MTREERNQERRYRHFTAFINVRRAGILEEINFCTNHLRLARAWMRRMCSEHPDFEQGAIMDNFSDTIIWPPEAR